MEALGRDFSVRGGLEVLPMEMAHLSLVLPGLLKGWVVTGFGTWHLGGTIGFICWKMVFILERNCCWK